MGLAPKVSACPMMKEAGMTMMDCAKDCPGCASHENDEKNNCCGDGFSRCGVTLTSSVFYAPTETQAVMQDVSSIKFMLLSERAESKTLSPDKRPPKFLS